MATVIARVAAVAIVAVGILGGPSATHAATVAVDPRCVEVFGLANIVPEDPDDAVAGLPPQVTLGDMACWFTFGSTAYVYLDDPFGKLTATLDSLVADGWIIEEVLEDDTRVPFDIATLPSHEADGEFTVAASRGENIIGIVYITDADDFFGTGLFVYASPLVGGAPAAGVGIDDPSSFSELRTLATAAPNATQSAILIGAAAILTVLLAIPGFLLSTVFTSRYGQWFGWLDRGRVGEFRKRAAGGGTSRRRWIFIGAGLVFAAFISGFVDPRFGFNGMSLRLFFTMLLSFVIFTVGGWAVTSAVLKRIDTSLKPDLSFHPAALLVLTVAVILSRLLGFSPGVVFGLVAGVAFAVTLALSRRAAVVLIGSGYSIAVALIAWIVYSVLNASGPPSGAALVGISEVFSGITVEAVSTIPIALIPLLNLDGGALFSWKKWVWAVAYAAGLAVFMLVLFTIPGGDAEVNGDFTRWIVIFAVFVVLAIAVWFVDWVIRRRSERVALGPN